ncbi:MAG: TIGR03663 family protein [Anaerolineales bacterium]|nr:TIGR03663 family protein [Anaerolineales bacterium]
MNQPKGKTTAAQAGDDILDRKLTIRWEIVAFVLLVVLAVITRFADLETRVMSHDESLHTYYSWLYSQGRGFQHTPLMHGPLQFHLVAASFFLFGDTDTTAHFPAALAGAMAVGMLWYFRRWLGTLGAIAAAALMLVSPYMLYYSRYVRNEAFVVVEGLLMFLAVFRYFETRQSRWLYLLAAALSLHAATKETHFIYVAQLLVFLAVALAWQLLRTRWPRPGLKTGFVVGLMAAGFGALVALLTLVSERSGGGLVATGETAAPLDPGEVVAAAGAFQSPLVAIGILLALAGAVLLAVTLILAFGRRLRTHFAYLDLLVISGTLTLPLLASIPANLLGWDPLAYSDPQSVNKTGAVLLLLVGISAVVGLVWDWRRWLIAAGVFAAIFVPLYSSLFTHGPGVLSGLVGSLGYWLVQHGVERGSQPLYYYLLIQLPMYEFLPALAALLAGIYALAGLHRKPGEPGPDLQARFPVPEFLAYWCLTSLVLYTFAGERMPWLTVHITLPMILLGGWGIGRLLESIDWSAFSRGRAWLVLLGVGLLLVSLPKALGALLGSPPPFQGKEMLQLEATTGFLAATAASIGAIVLLVFAMRGWSWKRLGQLLLVGFAGLLYLLTARAAFRAAYITPDLATEFLVYAHSSPAVKVVLGQVEDLSRRMNDGLSIDVAYDDDVSWPYSWYFRNYRNVHYYGPNPTRELLNYPVIIAGDNNWAKIEPLLGDRYQSFEYIRMWWPTQEYFGLTWERIRGALTSAEYRQALMDIWLNRDYTAYGELRGIDFSQKNWSPSDRMKLFIRKDIVSQVWDYGAAPEALAPVTFVDPYEGGMSLKAAEPILGFTGTSAGQFSKPRAIDVAPDGSLYVADTLNHRIQHLAPTGEVLQVWGELGRLDQGEAPGGTFNEPWDVAVAPDGSVYVADTWNHRVQHFGPTGEFLGMIGTFGQAESPTAFWGPRSVAVDEQGRLFVSDTGNKRVAIFDDQGASLGQFGVPGYLEGQLDEPVGLAVDNEGRVYIADTWNQRIQVFEETEPNVFEPIREWPIEGWYGQSLDNKPYLAVSSEGIVCASDPEGYRVLCFDQTGKFLQGWGDFGATESTFDLPTGLEFDAQGNLWVVDAGNGRLMRFSLADGG